MEQVKQALQTTWLTLQKYLHCSSEGNSRASLFIYFHHLRFSAHSGRQISPNSQWDLSGSVQRGEDGFGIPNPGAQLSWIWALGSCWRIRHCIISLKSSFLCPISEVFAKCPLTEQPWWLWGLFTEEFGILWLPKWLLGVREHHGAPALAVK